MHMEDSGGRFFYFLTGVGIGALIGIMFAPRSGDQTREMIVGKADEGREFLRRRGREIRDQATEFVERGKQAVSQEKEHLTAAIEAGKQAYRSESQPKPSAE